MTVQSRTRHFGATLMVVAVIVGGFAAPARAAGPGSISGTVHLGELGLPSGADDVRVGLFPPATATGDCYAFPTAWTDASGAFSFSGLCPGTYTGNAVYMLDGRYGEVAWGPVTVDGNDIDGLDIVVPANLSIQGEITDASGTVLGGIDVIAYRFDEDIQDWVLETTGETTAQGSYVLAPLEEGYYSVLFDDPSDEYSATWWGGVAWWGVPDVVYVDEPVVLDEYLDRVARFRGYIQPEVTLAEAPNVTVEALFQDPDTGNWIGTGYTATGYVVSDFGGTGYYEFTDLPPGDYRFQYTYSGSMGVDSYVPRTYHFEPGDRWWRNTEFVLPALPAAQVSFVRALYEDFLGRQPVSWESTALVQRLVGGQVTRYGAATELSRSNEWITSVITNFYHDTLNREPDASGLSGWVRAAQSGMPIAQIAAAFYSSQEYFQTVGNSDYTTWVTDLYQKLLLRAPETAGLNSWVAALQRGVSRDAVAMGFYQSPEKLGVRITALYQQLLGRAPESGAVQHWSPFVASNGDLVLAAAIAGSQEYFNRAQLPPSGP